MAKSTRAIYHFNRGLISRLALARVDIKRTAFSAEQMTNWMPRVLGSMMLRPGLQYLGAHKSPAQGRLVPFVFALDDTALIELSPGAMRVWRNDLLITRPAVTTTITNGTFDTDLANWTDDDEAGAVSAWVAGGFMGLTGTGTSAAIREQHVTVAAANQNIEHALRISITRGPVTVRVGSTSGGDEYVAETDLATGFHSLAFAPTGDFYVRFSSRLKRITLVDSCVVESPGPMELPTPWTGDALPFVRIEQSADVLFIACKALQQRRIERRSSRSWSVVLYLADDGPFRAENLGPITIAPSALNGNVTLTASGPLFKSSQVGGLIKIRSTGQRVTASISAQNTFTNTIRVVGVGEARRFSVVVDGVFVATVNLQRSIGVVGNWEDVATYTADFDDTFNDGLDNQEIYYRIGIKTGNYTSGTTAVTLTYTLGSITGICRITAFTNNTTVDAEVLQDFGGTDASDLWSEGQWSDRRGWPTAVALAEGRMWWAGKNGIWGSVSDAYDSFDPDFEGDAGPINRTIGSGPVDSVSWLLPLQRLMLGAASAEHSLRSSALDEPLTPTNFNVKQSTTQGSAPISATKIDARGIFVQRSGRRLYELAFDPQTYDYGATDLTALIPELGAIGIVAVAVQRQPDTRIHCALANGEAGVAVIDRVENVLSWQLVQTEGFIDDVAVLPGTDFEDNVYYSVRRTLGDTGVETLTVVPGTGYTSRPTLTFANGGGFNAAATIDLVAVSIAISAAGSGYSTRDTLTITGGTHSVAAVLTVLTVDGSGGVLTASIANPGDYTGLPANPAATTTSGAGTGCTVTLTWGLGGAAITNPGYAYSSAPDITIVGGGGSGASVTCSISTSTEVGHYLEKWAFESEARGGTLNKQADSFVLYQGASTPVTEGFVSAVTVIPGSGYAAPPTVVFSGGGGTGAAATAYLGFVGPVSVLNPGSGNAAGNVLSMLGGTFTRPARFRIDSTFGSGQVSSLTIIDPGAYSVLPLSASTLTGGSGTNIAISTTSSFFGVSEVDVTNPGSGYTSAPAVALIGPATVQATASASVTGGTTTSPAGTSIITGLRHLEGNEVIVWADGVDLSPEVNGVQKTYTVLNGQITVSGSVISQAVVGLPYQGTWVSHKLANIGMGDGGVGLTQRNKVTQLGVILLDTHAKGLKFGSQADYLDPLPEIEAGAVVPGDRVWVGYDADMIEFPGEWGTDSRLWLVANAPRPCTVLAAVLAIEEHAKQ